jgi:hypothetical protein
VKVKHGALRVHGLASLPKAADTHDRADGDPAGAENSAITLAAELIVTVQIPVPLQAPRQPLKVAPFAGVAVSVTEDPPP